MIIVHAEHEIRDFDAWKTAFDRDPIRREQSGVRRYCVVRPADDPNFVIMDFEFETEIAAREFQAALHQLWASPAAAPALRGTRRPGGRAAAYIIVAFLLRSWYPAAACTTRRASRHTHASSGDPAR